MSSMILKAVDAGFASSLSSMASKASASATNTQTSGSCKSICRVLSDGIFEITDRGGRKFVFRVRRCGMHSTCDHTMSNKPSYSASTYSYPNGPSSSTVRLFNPGAADNNAVACFNERVATRSKR